jgi:hypothetical protein
LGFQKKKTKKKNEEKEEKEGEQKLNCIPQVFCAHRFYTIAITCAASPYPLTTPTAPLSPPVSLSLSLSRIYPRFTYTPHFTFRAAITSLNAQLQLSAATVVCTATTAEEGDERDDGELSKKRLASVSLIKIR